MPDGEAGAMLDWALRGAAGLREPPDPAPGDAELVAYLAGALTPDDSARIERGLVTHAAARRRLRDVAARMDILQASPWSETAAGDTVALAWRDLVEARLGAVASARDRWLADGWDRVRARAAAGVADAQAAWAALLSHADQWDRARRLPQLALARGGSGPVTAALPSDVVLVLEAEITEPGDLAARLWVRDMAGRPSSALDGRAVTLSLAAGDLWPLGQDRVRGGEASWSLTGAGGDLGLPPGPLAVEGLAVTLGPSSPPAVRALVASDSGEGGSLVELWGQSQRVAGNLRLALALPALTRAARAGRLLALSGAVAPSRWQRLAAWPVSDWGDGPRDVEAPCPGPDGDFDPALLRIDFLEPSAPTQ